MAPSNQGARSVADGEALMGVATTLYGALLGGFLAGRGLLSRSMGLPDLKWHANRSALLAL